MEDPEEVVAVEEMGPWRLRKHINLRHIPAGDYRSVHDGKVYDLKQLPMRKCFKEEGQDAVTRAYHDRCHRLHPERYDHVHTD